MTKNYKNILISGGSSGIGRAVALHYAGLHDTKTIYICGRNKTRLDETKKEIKALGCQCVTTVLDVRKKTATRQWIETSFKTTPLDLVIVNAGISGGTGSGAGNAKTFYKREQSIVNVNIQGALNTLYPALECFQTQGYGHIAVVGSQAGYFPMPSAPAYASTKGFVMQYLHSLSPVLNSKNITTSVIVPGFVKSRITDQNNFHMPFFMSAEDAAEIIVQGLAEKKSVISFPWPMRCLISAIRFLPDCVIRWLFSKMPKKP